MHNTVRFAEYDLILVNSSAGKDSQAMLDVVMEQAKAEGCEAKVQVVHCDLGRVEWTGTRELAEEQAAHYGLPFHVVSRAKGDLLTQVEQRGMWPSSTARYCTSDHKRDQVHTLLTKLVAAANLGRAMRILDCQGIRAAESSERAKKSPLQVNKKASNGKREVTTWFPIFDWSTAQVWDRIKQSGVRSHYAYDLGMSRLSCVFCVFAPVKALVIAGQHNPELLAQYVAVENRIGHTFRKDTSILSIQTLVATGAATVSAAAQGGDWCQGIAA